MSDDKELSAALREISVTARQLEERVLDCAKSEPKDRLQRLKAIDTTLVLVSDYLRANGLRDPNEIAQTATQYLHAALSELKDRKFDCLELEHAALQRAAALLGLAGKAKPGSRPAQAGALHMLSPSEIVPESIPRNMPGQPLGELPELPTAAAILRQAAETGAGVILAVVTKGFYMN